MIFCGPTGVGKTELTKAVSELYYGAEKARGRAPCSAEWGIKCQEICKFSPNCSILSCFFLFF